MKKALYFLLTLGFIVQPLVVSAQALNDSQGFDIDPKFNPNLVLTDDDVFDLTAMNKSRLLAFMDSKGTLANVMTPDIDGVNKSTADIIWRVANSYQINPEFLLALLQKEQSLVEGDSPSQRALDWATGFGVCDDCSKDDPAIQNYKGFANQLEYAAKQMREKNLIRLLGGGQTLSGLAPGKPTTIDGVMVTPANMATASLYTYTPHIHGNQNLWHIWERWFTRNFPDGTVVRGQPSGDIFWIRDGVKRPFASGAVASTLVDPAKIVDVSDTDLAAYDDGAAIAFPNYALLMDPEGKIWLIVDQERRRILNMDAFRKFGFNLDEVEDVTDADLAPYDIAEPISVDTKYPQGALLQDATTKDVWYAENGSKQLIEDPAILALYFKGRKAKKTASTDLGALENDGVYKLHDGELIKSATSSAVYVLENGIRRPILSGDVFEGLGWKWKNVISLPAKVVEEYDIGQPVTLDTPEVQVAQNVTE